MSGPGQGLHADCLGSRTIKPVDLLGQLGGACGWFHGPYAAREPWLSSGQGLPPGAHCSPGAH
eukprot:13004099-Heterocapsa_arctica.AAC.1